MNSITTLWAIKNAILIKCNNNNQFVKNSLWDVPEKSQKRQQKYF